MELELNKYYLAANGAKVQIIHINEKDIDYPIIGLVCRKVFLNRLTIFYDIYGNSVNSCNAPEGFDLVMEWVEKIESPVFDWAKAAAWHNYGAMDNSGSWYLFKNKPNLDDHFGRWFEQGIVDYSKIPEEYYPIFKGDYKDSLVERPRPGI